MSASPAPPPYKLLVCVNAIRGSRKQCCAARGSVTLAAAIERGVEARGIDIAVERIVCLGQCHRGPSMRIAPGGPYFFRVTADQIPAILDRLGKFAGTRAPGDGDDSIELLYPGA